MTELQLYIEGQEVELHDNESVVLKQALQDVRSLDKVFTDFTRTFNVPASKVNNKIFKHFYNFNIVGFDARHKQDAELNLNYKPFKKGKIKLEGVQMKDNQPLNYRLTFYGSLVSLKSVFASDKISSLDGLSIDINYTSTGVSNLLQNGQDILLNGETITRGFIAPLITHTDRLYYNSAEDTAGTFNLHPGIEDKGVVWNQLKPAVKVYAIVKAIEFKYNIKFSDDFFSLTNTAFENLYLWLHKQKGGIFAEDDRNLVTVSGWNNIQGSLNGGSFGLGSFLNQSIDIDANRYITRLSVACANATEYEVMVYYDEEIIYSSEHTGGATQIRQADQFRVQNPTRVNGQSALDSDRIYIRILSNAADTFSVGLDIADVYADGSKRTISAMTAGVNSTIKTIVATDQMPDIGVMDFLTGMFKMFNLTAFFEDNIIKVLTLDQFYANAPKVYDITRYLDKANSEVNSALPYSLINFKYKEAKSFFAANHKQQFNQEWGSLSYDDLGSAQGPTYTVQLPFENQKFERLKDSGGTTFTTVQWGFSVDIKQDPYLGKPLLFYAMREDASYGVLNQISYMDAVDGNASTISAYFIPSNSVDPLTDTQTLNFGSEKSEYARTNYDKSLFSTYYKNYIVDTFSQSRRLSKFQAYLPLTTFSKLNLQDKIVVFNNLYKINTISTNLQTGLSALELINEVTDFTVSATANQESEARTADSTRVVADTTEVRASLGLQRI